MSDIKKTEKQIDKDEEWETGDIITGLVVLAFLIPFIIALWRWALS